MFWRGVGWGVAVLGGGDKRRGGEGNMSRVGEGMGK